MLLLCRQVQFSSDEDDEEEDEEDDDDVISLTSTVTLE